MRADGLNGDTRGAESLLILPDFDCCFMWHTSSTKERFVYSEITSPKNEKCSKQKNKEINSNKRGKMNDLFFGS